MSVPHRRIALPAPTPAGPLSVQCSRCFLVLLGTYAGVQMAERIPHAEQGVCWRCWGRMRKQHALEHRDAPLMPAYDPENRHIRRGPLLIPRAVMQDVYLNGPAMMLYAELYLRGASATWVAASNFELAEAVNLSYNAAMYGLKRLLSRGYVEVRKTSATAITAYHLASVPEPEKGGAA